MQQVGYVVVGPPRCVLEAAAAKGFTQVSSKAVIDLCLKSCSLRVGGKPQQKVSSLIEAFREEWGWNAVDVARAMQHTLPGYSNTRNNPAATQAQSPEVPPEILEMADALNAADEAAQANLDMGAAPPAANIAVDVPGFGQVNAALLEALAAPLRPSQGKAFVDFCIFLGGGICIQKVRSQMFFISTTSLLLSLPVLMHTVLQASVRVQLLVSGDAQHAADLQKHRRPKGGDCDQALGIVWLMLQPVRTRGPCQVRTRGPWPPAQARTAHQGRP